MPSPVPVRSIVSASQLQSEILKYYFTNQVSRFMMLVATFEVNEVENKGL
jgi:hypothetical protein